MKKVLVFPIILMLILTASFFTGCSVSPSQEANTPSGALTTETALESDPVPAESAEPEPSATPEPTVEPEPEYEQQLFYRGMMVFATDQWKFGFMDKTGNVVIEPKFDHVYPFPDHSNFWKKGLFIADQAGKAYIFDIKGEKVCDTAFDSISDFRDNGLATVRVDGKYGCIDEYFDFAIEPVFGSIDMLCFGEDGLAAAALPEEKWGFINASGEFVIEPRFDAACDFSWGLAAVKIDGKWGYIDVSGNIVIEPQFEWTPGDFTEDGYAKIYLTGENDPYIDREGNLVDSFEVDFMTNNLSKDFGLMLIKGTDPKLGITVNCFADADGNIVIMPDYTMAIKGDFASNGLAPIEGYVDDGTVKAGFIDTTGEIAIELKFDEVDGFNRRGLASARMGSKWGLINDKGEFVLEPISEEKIYFSPYGYAAVKTSDGWGFADTNGNIVIEPQFMFVGVFYEDGYAVVYNKEGYGVIDAAGNFVIEPSMEYACLDWN